MCRQWIELEKRDSSGILSFGIYSSTVCFKTCDSLEGRSECQTVGKKRRKLAIKEAGDIEQKPEHMKYPQVQRANPFTNPYSHHCHIRHKRTGKQLWRTRISTHTHTQHERTRFDQCLRKCARARAYLHTDDDLALHDSLYTDFSSPLDPHL